jgi:hypothetical protein
MRKMAYIVAVVLLSLGGASAFACPTQWTGPYGMGGAIPSGWYNYSLPASCYTLGGGMTSAVVGCSGTGGWQATGSRNSAQASFTLDSSDPILNPTAWTISTQVEVSSLDSDGADTFQFQVSVAHPNGTWSYYTIFSWNSTLASICGAQQWGYFTANTGDTIYINISGRNVSGTATLKASIPSILNNYN